MAFLRIPTLLAAACIAGLAGARDLDVKLPDIGSSAGTVMSPQDQREYGASVLHELRSYGYVLDDALLDEYINALGYKLVSNSDRPDLPFTFFVVRDNEINAFAVPGGYIAANAGLIINMSREDELAAVLAHEISHITQQHLLRAFEDMKKMSLPTMLAMLGILIASSHRTDDAGTAAIMTGTSLMQQRQINFTRHDEAEADRVGIQTMARAGYDPMAMADTFSTLQRVMRVNGIDVPEFLMDHPVDTSRIADAKARAQNLVCSNVQPVASAHTQEAQGPLNLNLPSPHAAQVHADDSDETAIASSNAATMSVAKHGEPGTLPRVSVTACGMHTVAQETYFELMRETSARARVRCAVQGARVLRRQSRPQFRVRHAGESLWLCARDDAFRRSDAGRRGAAQARAARAGLLGHEARARRCARPVWQQAGIAGGLRAAQYRFPGQPRGHAELRRLADGARGQGQRAPCAGAAAAAGRALCRPTPSCRTVTAMPASSPATECAPAEAYAEAAYLNGHAEDALNQLRALSKLPDLTFYQRSRVDARITQLTPEVLALRKRGMREESEPPGSLSLKCCDQPAR